MTVKNRERKDRQRWERDKTGERDDVSERHYLHSSTCVEREHESEREMNDNLLILVFSVFIQD